MGHTLNPVAAETEAGLRLKRRESGDGERREKRRGEEKEGKKREGREGYKKKKELRNVILGSCE